jgi:hypothetical protein
MSRLLVGILNDQRRRIQIGGVSIIENLQNHQKQIVQKSGNQVKRERK